MSIRQVQFPAVSVIVPVYNVEQYLPECLRSIQKQTFSDLEVLVINDGSTDSSLNIAHEIVDSDSRFHVYSQNNIGLGETRNRGILLASGKYLFFVDSDDYIDHEYIEALYRKALSTNADVVEGEFVSFPDGEDALTTKGQELSKAKGIKINSDNIEYFFKDYYIAHVYGDAAWNKLYRRQFVLDHHLQFGDNKKIFAEDSWFQLMLMQSCPSVEFVSGPQYHYRVRSSSITQSPKMDFLKRHGQMLEDYYQLTKDDVTGSAHDKMRSYLATLDMIYAVQNQTEYRGAFSDFKKEIIMLGADCRLVNSLRSYNSFRAYTLESKKSRILFWRTISLLYSAHLDGIANRMIWKAYSGRQGD